MAPKKVSSHIVVDDDQPAAPPPLTRASVAMSMRPLPEAAPPASQTDMNTLPRLTNPTATMPQQDRSKKRKALTIDTRAETTLDKSQRRRQNSNADYVPVAPVPLQQAPASRPGSLSGVSLPSLIPPSMSSSRQDSISQQGLNPGIPPFYPAQSTAQVGTTQGNYATDPSPIPGSRNASISSSQFAPQYQLPLIRTNPTPSPRTTQMPPPPQQQPQPLSATRRPSTSSPEIEVLALRAQLNLSQAENAATARNLSDCAFRLRQCERANADLHRALHNATQAAALAPRRETLSSIPAASEQLTQSMIDNLQREKNALLAKNEQHKSQIRRLNEELNKVMNELPSDREPLVRENMELRVRLQRSAGILTSIEKKVAGAMNDEDNGDGHTGK